MINANMRCRSLRTICERYSEATWQVGSFTNMAAVLASLLSLICKVYHSSTSCAIADSVHSMSKRMARMSQHGIAKTIEGSVNGI